SLMKIANFQFVCSIMCSLAIAAILINLSFAIPLLRGSSSSLLSKTHHDKSPHSPDVSSAITTTGSDGNTKVIMINFDDSNKTQVNVVAKYYSLARTGSDPLMFLHCNGFKNHPQTDCRTFLPDGTLSYANRYDIRSQSFDHIHSNIALTPTQLFQQFVQRVN